MAINVNFDARKMKPGTLVHVYKTSCVLNHPDKDSNAERSERLVEANTKVIYLGEQELRVGEWFRCLTSVGVGWVHGTIFYPDAKPPYAQRTATGY